jgi:hypothetical protein
MSFNPESRRVGPVSRPHDPPPIPDEPRPDGSDRYAVYAVVRGTDGSRPARLRLAETSADGIGTCLITLRDEGQFHDDHSIGILDRVERRWIVNPWATGRSLP